MPTEKEIEKFQGSEAQRREHFRAGRGNWEAFSFSMGSVWAAAKEWAEAIEGIEKPWLCWNVDPDWCLVQQRLAIAMGWIPIVGTDPRAKAPSLEEHSVFVDFNRHLQLPTMSMLFPLEFVFLFTERIAFWHSDLLVREKKLKRIAEKFENLENGQTTAVDARPGWLGRLQGKKGRFWELIGCTTREASRHQFEVGAGWWRHIENHPNCPNTKKEKVSRLKYPYDHGSGILYWKRHHGGEVLPIRQDCVEEGHCTSIGRPEYIRVSPRDERRDLTKELSENYSLRGICQRLNIDYYHAKP